MTLNNQTPLFRGIIPPLVTPLRDRDTLDEVGLSRLLEHVVAGGVHGVFLLGSTGEGPSLSYRLRRELIGQACEIIAGRVPVLVGITDTSFVESVNLSLVAEDAGASAVVLSTPYYFPPSQPELVSYVDRLVEELPLPLMLYNMPDLTKVWFEIDTLQSLAKHPAIIGIKDSSGDLVYFERLMEIRKVRPDWSILMGPEALLVEAMRLGSDGAVAGGANVVPRLFVECYQAAGAKDARTQELLRLIERLQQIYQAGESASRFVKGTKCALSILGLCDDVVAEPFGAFGNSEREMIEKVLTEIMGITGNVETAK
ncbi:MAG: dihydrodipicolinate synthase family protein [Gemmataceae bacterium]